jgi:hypothetical protein
MNVEAAKLDLTQYTVQYELLRSQVMPPAPNAARGDTAADPQRGVGLALLLSEGMPGWLKTVETVLRAAIAPQAAEPALHQPSSQSSAASVWFRRACNYMRSPRFWRVWFSRLDLSPTDHRGGISPW